MTGGSSMSKIRRLEFLGSWFWLVFWAIVFLPVGLIYFAVKSIVIEEEVDAGKFVEWYRSQKARKGAPRN
jgi:hypothetical protein